MQSAAPTAASTSAATAAAAGSATPMAAATATTSTSVALKPSKSSVAAPLPAAPLPWEPRSINLYKRENMTLIGEGTYGSVWLAKAPNGAKVALKKIRKEKKEGFPITAIREIKLLKALKHPNIVSLKDVVSSHMPGKEGDVFLVFEFLEHDLTGLLESKVQMSEALVKYYMKSILEGLHYLHSKLCLHRDIKGANILVSNNGDVRIADLGLARGMAKGGYTNRVVTLWYRAPELLLGSCDYDAKIDMWSLGCLFAELLTRGTVLFPGNSTELDQLNKIYAVCGTMDETTWPGVSKLKYFAQFTPKPQKRVLRSMFASQRSQCAIDLLDKLLTLNPAERLSAEQALDHEYFFEEPLAIEPHQHPNFNGNHHEFGSKQKRRNPPPKQQGTAANNNSNTANAAPGGGGGGGGGGRGPAPFDRMQVSSHAQFGVGGGSALYGSNPPHQPPPGAYNNHAPHQQQQQQQQPATAYPQQQQQHNNHPYQQQGNYRRH